MSPLAKDLGNQVFLSPESALENEEGLDEDSVWKYPVGFTPPVHVIKEASKKIAMRRTQKVMNDIYYFVLSSHDPESIPYYHPMIPNLFRIIVP